MGCCQGKLMNPICKECMKRPANLFLIPCEHHICHLCAFPLMDIYEKRRRQIAYKGPIARAMASIDSDFSEIIFKSKIVLCRTCREYAKTPLTV